jgi:thiamine kinase
MAQSLAEIELRKLLASRLPAVNTAGCRFSPVQGLSGESWRIEGEGVQLLARQQTAEKALLGVNRRREARMLRGAGNAFGPRVLWQNNQWIIVEWLAGDVVTQGQFTALLEDGKLPALVANLHQRLTRGYRLNLQQQFSRYWQQIDRRRITPRWLRWQQYFLQTSPPKPLQLAPLHMDIHPANLIAQGKSLRLIDWEYATDGDIALELAAMFRFNQWSSAQQQIFIQHYVRHGYHHAPLLEAQIQRWLPWVDYLMLMWFEVRWQQSGDREFLRWGAALQPRFNSPKI